LSTECGQKIINELSSMFIVGPSIIISASYMLDIVRLVLWRGTLVSRILFLKRQYFVNKRIE